MSTGDVTPAVTYRQLLARPWVVVMLVGAVIGRLPTAMMPIAVTLSLRAHHLGFGLAGLATAAYAAGQAVGGPLLSRLVDRGRQTAVLVAGGIVSSAAFCLIAVFPSVRAVILAGSFVAGAATPPIEPCLRALWPALAGPENLQRAYSLDSAAQEVIFVSGPLLVALAVLASSPEGALLLTAVLGVVGTLVVAGAEPSRRWRGEASTAGFLGPLRSGRLVLLLVALAGCAAPVGGLAIVVVAYAEQHWSPGGGSVLLGVQALGALTGAVVNGHIRWRAGPPRRAVVIAALMALAYLSLATTPPFPLMALLSFVAGSFLPPLLVASYTMTDRLAPGGTVVEAFAWLVTLFAVGIAGGSALAGAMRQASGTAAAAASVAGLGLVGAVLLAGFAALVSRPASPARSAAPS